MTIKSDSQVSYDSVYFNESITDLDKSMLLVRAMEHVTALDHAFVYDWYDVNDINTLEINLYDPANMAAAWHVHYWAVFYARDIKAQYREWWESVKPWMVLECQEWMLDKILELCIGARIIEVEVE